MLADEGEAISPWLMMSRISKRVGIYACNQLFERERGEINCRRLVSDDDGDGERIVFYHTGISKNWSSRLYSRAGWIRAVCRVSESFRGAERTWILAMIVVLGLRGCDLL